MSDPDANQTTDITVADCTFVPNREAEMDSLLRQAIDSGVTKAIELSHPGWHDAVRRILNTSPQSYVRV